MVSEFEKDVLDAAKRSIVKVFTEGGFVLPDYANRYKIPADLVQRVYALVDYDKVIAALEPRINDLVADRIAAALAQELTNDIKTILSDRNTRERLRGAVRGVLEQAR